jgi:hypothetical protein
MVLREFRLLEVNESAESTLVSPSHRDSWLFDSSSWNRGLFCPIDPTESCRSRASRSSTLCSRRAISVRDQFMLLAQVANVTHILGPMLL